MTDPNRWYFSKEKIQNSPSRLDGIDEDREIHYRQHAANFIQDMGQRLQVTQLCINTAIVYMHRFYMFHSFSKFHKNAIAACAIFLAAKVEEQPRKVEHVIKVAHWCLNQRTNRQTSQLDTRSPEYTRQANELVINENIMLQTLGFEIGIEHPHTSVVKFCQLVKDRSLYPNISLQLASKDLAQTSYFMATNSLQLTTMCLQYKPTIVACFCIHVACKWANWAIPVSSEGKQWFYYVDETVTPEILENLTSEFLFRFERLSDRVMRRKIDSNGSSNNDKKTLSSTAQQQQIEQRSKQTSSTLNSTDSQLNNSNNKLIQQPSTSSSRGNSSTTDQPSSSHNHQSNNNFISNGPIKENKMIDQTDKSNVNKQFNDNIKSSSSHSSSSSTSLATSAKAFTNNNNNNNNNSSSNKNLNQTVINHQQQQQQQPPQKPPTKQQQIQLEKQRQQDERNRIKPKNQDYLWDNKPLTNLNKQTNNNQTSSSSSSIGPSFLNNNSSSTNSSTINHSFFDNLINSSSIYNNNSNSSNDNNSLSKSPRLNWDLFAGSNSNEDSFEPKRDLNSDLKMEFSDNDSNQSGVNLNTLPFMNDAINGQIDNQINLTTNPTTTKSSIVSSLSNQQSNISSKNSFMSIFKTEDTIKNNYDSNLKSSDTNLLSNNLTNNHSNLISSQQTNLSTSNLSSHNNNSQSLVNSIFNTQSLPPPPPSSLSNNTNISNSIGIIPHQQQSSLLSHLSSQSFLTQSTVTGTGFSNSLMNFNQSNLNPPAKSTDNNNLLLNHNLYNNSFPTTMGTSITNSFNSSNQIDSIQQTTNLLLNDSSYKSSSSGKSKNKDKDKDRESKHHKKHKSKDKHKKHKSKDKERGSSKHSSSEDQKILEDKKPSQLKLIIKKNLNDKSDDNNSNNSNGDVKPQIEKLKIKIPIMNIHSSTNERKRKHSPKDNKEKKSRIE